MYTYKMGNRIILYSVVLFMLVFGQTKGLLENNEGYTVEATFQTLSQEIEKLQQQVSVLQSQVNATKTGPIAFTAGLSQTITNMGTHQQIVFDNVITNVGNAYSPLYGHFTAPVKGVYVFFVMLTNIPGHSASIHLLKNAKWIGNAFAHGSSSDGGLYVTSTIAITVQLQQGDHVWVQNEHAFSTVEELDGGNWSFFSGHLIGAN